MVDKVSLDKLNNYLKILSEKIDVELMLDDSLCRNYKDFILYVYNSKEYLETGNISSALVGNKPIVVKKKTDKLYSLINDDITDLNFQELLKLKLIELIDY